MLVRIAVGGSVGGLVGFEVCTFTVGSNVGGNVKTGEGGMVSQSLTIA